MIAPHATSKKRTISPDRADELVTAAINAAAAASVAYHEELERFRYVLTLGSTHGATVQQLATAAGITAEQVSTLINQGQL